MPYHGKREVIKSPVEDIVSAHTVAGHADMTHWREADDTQDSDGIDGLFWRQTYDPVNNSLSVFPLLPPIQILINDAIGSSCSLYLS
jgi:hypothetical protein